MDAIVRAASSQPDADRMQVATRRTNSSRLALLAARYGYTDHDDLLEEMVWIFVTLVDVHARTLDSLDANGKRPGLDGLRLATPAVEGR